MNRNHFKVLAAFALLASACASPAPKAGDEPDAAIRVQRPLSCPRCQGRPIVPIVYGLLNAAGLQKVRDSLVVSGGCLVDRENPDWHCKACNYEWYDANDPKRKAAWDAIERENQEIYDRFEAKQKLKQKLKQ